MGALATSGRLLGGSWETLGRLLGGSWEALGRLLELLGAFWGSYGSSGMLPGSHVGDLGGCWTHLGVSWSALGASCEGLGSLLRASEDHLGGILELFDDDFGAWAAVSKRLMKILKNLEKRCKVLQKSRFGGSDFHEKITLEGKLRPNLRPSRLIRVEVRGKIGKWTPFGHKVDAQKAS